MTKPNERPRAVVADGRPLGRNLIRFLLEEHGYDVVAETATAFDTVRAAGDQHPELVVVHENCIAPDSRFGIARVRGAAPSSRIVMVVASRQAVPRRFADAVDAVVEEGPGLRELVLALEGARLPVVEPAASAAASNVLPLRSRRSRWAERLQGAAVASIVLVALVMSRGLEAGGPSNTNVPPSIRAHLTSAYAKLDALAVQAPTADASRVVALARDLLAERAVALAAGVDVSELDRQISDMLTPLLPSLPPKTANAIVAILGPLVGQPVASGSPAPNPTQTPSVVPTPDQSGPKGQTPAAETTPPPVETESPSDTGTPSQTETPSPTDTGTPSPTDTGTPSPTDTGTPSPSDTGTPSPTDTGTPSPSNTGTPSPTDTGTPSPSETETPTETPTGTPSETQTETPTETPTPSDTGTPSETQTPKPSDTGTPSVTETPTPSETGTPTTTPTHGGGDGDDDDDDHGHSGSDAAVVLPPGLVLLVTSALARRRHRRSS